MNIWQIITQITEEAPKSGVDANKVINRLVYGVGTRLITSYGDSALGGVYKLVAVKNGDKWTPVIKISETIEKIPNPGTKELYRVYDSSGIAVADYITLSGEDPSKKEIIHLLHPQDPSKRRTLKTRDLKFELLLEKIIEEGKVVYKWPSIEEIRGRRETDLKKLDTGVKRLINPHIYHVSISEDLWNEKQEVLKRTLEAKG
jgi:nicotinate phosphoribosyltransferase